MFGAQSETPFAFTFEGAVQSRRSRALCAEKVVL
jgi:hypothetical protein